MKLTKLLSGIFFLLILGILTMPAQAQQQTSKTGLGLMIGSPTGISFKTYTSSANAVDAGLAWSVGRYDAVNLHVDYLWHKFDMFDDVDQGYLPVYYGIGGRLVFADNNSGDSDAILGVRIPVGLNYLFEDEPFGIFLEFAPVINVIPATDFDLDGALGARFYF